MGVSSTSAASSRPSPAPSASTARSASRSPSTSLSPSWPRRWPASEHALDDDFESGQDGAGYAVGAEGAEDREVEQACGGHHRRVLPLLEGQAGDHPQADRGYHALVPHPPAQAVIPFHHPPVQHDNHASPPHPSPAPPRPDTPQPP